jgi:hypothetical protein
VRGIFGRCAVAESFDELVRARNFAAYGVVGAAKVAVCSLNLADPEKAMRFLLAQLTEYDLADRAITEFHTSKKENHDGNPRAAA